MEYIRKLIAFSYWIAIMPLTILCAVILPIMSISDGVNIIQSGYTVKGGNYSVLMAILLFMYLSLRFKYIRRLYLIFPFLYEFLKYLIISSIFLTIGFEILNWSYISFNSSRRAMGIAAFILFIILWRIAVSVYYTKNPLVQFLEKHGEKLKKYSTPQD